MAVNEKEIIKEVAEKGRAILKQHKINLQPAGDLYTLPAGQFDAITLWHVLEHVHDLHPYMSRLKELLAADGRICIAVPNYTSYDAKRYGPYWAAYDVPRHLYHFSPQSMKMLLAIHGLRLLAEKPMWFDSFYISLLSEKYKTGKSRLAHALATGLSSNRRAIGHAERCSSLVYVIGK